MYSRLSRPSSRRSSIGSEMSAACCALLERLAVGVGHPEQLADHQRRDRERACPAVSHQTNSANQHLGRGRCRCFRRALDGGEAGSHSGPARHRREPAGREWNNWDARSGARSTRWLHRADRTYGGTGHSPHFVRNLGYDPQKDLQPVSLIAVFPLALGCQKLGPAIRAKGIPGAVPATRVQGCYLHRKARGFPAILRASFCGCEPAPGCPMSLMTAAGPPFRTSSQDASISTSPRSLRRCRTSLPVSSRPWRYRPPSGHRRCPMSQRWPRPALAILTRIMDRRLCAAGNPTPRGNSMNRAVNEILAQPTRAGQARGGEIVQTSPEQFASFVRSESARYVDLLQEEFCSRLLFGGCLGFGTLAD